jgi:hypothetical protein
MTVPERCNHSCVEHVSEIPSKKMNSVKPIFAAMALVFLTLCGFVGFDEPADATVIDLGNRREIFVSRYLLDNFEGTKLVKHSPHDEGEVMFFDKPWESTAPAYITILKDGDLYRAYYRGGHTTGEGKRTQNTCYAESKDGITWTKPSLGLIEINGSKENNVLLDFDPVAHNFSPFIDKNPNARPAEKYKALGGGSKSGLVAYVSEDGIRWKKLREDGVFKKGYFDSQNVSFWSESEKVYVCYFRAWTGTDGIKGYRSVGRTTSKDFVNWTDPVLMNFGDVPYEHIYTQQTSPYFRAPHIYVAIGSRFLPHRQIASEEQLKELKVDAGQHKGLSEAFFMTSRGGNVYDRTFMEAFLRPGTGLNHWSARTNYPSLNVVPTGTEEMSLYVNQDYAQPTGHLRRYSLRLDGFTSINGPYEGGTVTTRPFTFTGSELEINYSTSAAGEIRIAIQDENGHPIPGFSMEEAETLIGNAISRKVSWKGGTSVAGLRSRPVRLHIYLKDADLYSIKFN